MDVKNVEDELAERGPAEADADEREETVQNSYV